VLALVALLALSGCGDTSTPGPSGGSGDAATATPTANPGPVSIPGWQTYTDASFAFMVQYPPNWAKALEPQPQGALYEVVGFFAVGSASKGAAPTQNVITITAGQNQPNSTDGSAPPGFAPAGSVVVDGTTQTLLSGPGSAGGQGLLVMFALDNQIFLFYSTADALHAAQFHQTFTQMLSTFQVISTYE
jgi:hypothetical protein